MNNFRTELVGDQWGQRGGSFSPTSDNGKENDEVGFVLSKRNRDTHLENNNDANERRKKQKDEKEMDARVSEKP